MKTLHENIKALSNLTGTSGDEGRIKDYIYDEIKDFPNCTFSQDNAGNLVVVKKGKREPKNKLMFSAHMDEVGFIITQIDDKGFLSFTSVGGIDPRLMSGKSLLVGEKEIPGIMGCKAGHLVSADEMKKSLSESALYIDIGADSKEEALKLVSLGDRAVWDTKYMEFGSDCILGKALDDRVGCALLIELLKEDAPYTFTAAFTTREEVGGNGASSAAFNADPDIAVVIECTTAGDVADVPEAKWVCHQNGGPVVSFIDNGTLYDTELYKFTMKRAEEEGIPAQTKEGKFGGNDAAHIHTVRGGVRPVAVSLPARYIHAPAASLQKADIENALKLLKIIKDEMPAL